MKDSFSFSTIKAIFYLLVSCYPYLAKEDQLSFQQLNFFYLTLFFIIIVDNVIKSILRK